MSSKKKKLLKFLGSTDSTIRLKAKYMNQYYNLFMNMFEWKGIDKEDQMYIMRKLWSDGTVAAFKIQNTDMLGFCPYSVNSWNYIDFPATVSLINNRGVSFIPYTEQIVHKDVELCFAQYNFKPVRYIVEYYIDRMVQVDMVINTNIETHKLPFLLGVSPEDRDKVEDLMARILNNEIVVYSDFDAINLVKVLQTAPQYVIDKLHSYRIQLENELLTYLGIDNSGNHEKATTMLLDEINSNNAVINANQDIFTSCVGDWCKRIKETFDVTVSMKYKYAKAEETYESRVRSDANIENNFSRQGERE